MGKIFLLALSLIFIWMSYSGQDPNLSVAAQNKTTKNTKNPRKEISFENVSFNYDENWIAEVKSEIIPAAPLENKDDKPDYVRSRTVNFKLTYSNAKYDDDAAEISVYKIEEYKNAFSLVPGEESYVTEKEIKKLRKILRKSSKIKPSGFELPFVPWMDAHQVFHAKARIINFQNGNGLLFLTQTSQDAVSVVTGDDLEYCFQGFTDDGQYFVFAVFPVSAERLLGSEEAEEYWTIDRYTKNQKEYEKYINGTAEKREDFSNDKFTPNLSKIEDRRNIIVA